MWFISLCARAFAAALSSFMDAGIQVCTLSDDVISSKTTYLSMTGTSVTFAVFFFVLNALPSLVLFCQTSCPEQIQNSREAPRIFARHDSLLPRFEEQSNCCKGHSPKAGGIPSALTNNNGFCVLHTAYYFTPRRHFERDSRTDKDPADHPRGCTGESACNFTIIGGGCVVCFT